MIGVGFILMFFCCTGSYDVITVWMGMGCCMDDGSSATCLYKQEAVGSDKVGLKLDANYLTNGRLWCS